MAKKQYYIVVDTETTIKNTVADFGAVVCDKQGNVVAQCAILVRDNFDTMQLFYIAGETDKSSLWALEGEKRRREAYDKMLNEGSRSLASVAAINRWLEKVAAKYNPTLTAYNLAFDLDKMTNTGIDVTMFPDRFCLWAAAVGNVTNTKPFRNFALQNHSFNNVTSHGNMTMQTNAEVVAGFIGGVLTKEPHTALEDVLYYELPILKHIVKKAKWRERITPYSWSKHQVRDLFSVK